MIQKEGEIICDPCCGSGGFLIKAFEYVREQIEIDIQKTKEKIKEHYLSDDKNTEKVNKLISDLNEDLNLKNSDGRLNQLSSKTILALMPIQE